MNRRHIIILSTVLSIGVLTVWHGCTKEPELIKPRQLSPSSSSGQHAPKSIKEPETKAEYEALVREKSIAFAKKNNVPISFYGRVVDQDNNPLQGAVVDFLVTTIPMIPIPWGPSEKIIVTCATDQNGLFSLEGKRGSGLNITGLAKQGYRESGYYPQASVRCEPHDPQRHIPERNKPVEFMMIRDDLPKAEEVLSRQLLLNWNAENTTIDFGSTIGKLEFTASRIGRDANDTTKKFEWEVKMKAIGFTMTKLQSKNERMAPREGYSSMGRVGFSPDKQTWKHQTEESYAIQTNNGAYGLMKLSVYGDGNDGGVSGRVTVYLNKSGARNIDHK
jgi:hypothetical protein